MRRMPSRPARYSDEAAKAILERALAFDDSEFSRDDLVAMADDLGISGEQLYRAEAEMRQRSRDLERREFIRARRRKALKQAALYLAFGCLIFLLRGFWINVMLMNMFLMPLVFLGMYLLVQVIDALFRRSGPDLEREFLQWLEERNSRA